MEDFNAEKILENVPAINVKEENGQQLVSARELYKGLELKKRFSSWVETNFGEFTENEDFMSVLSSTLMPNGGTKAIQDFLITVDMAKQLCLMSRTEKGKIYRRYFIEVERRWNDPQEVSLPAKPKLETNNRKQRLAQAKQFACCGQRKDETKGDFRRRGFGK